MPEGKAQIFTLSASAAYKVGWEALEQSRYVIYLQQIDASAMLPLQIQVYVGGRRAASSVLRTWNQRR